MIPCILKPSPDLQKGIAMAAQVNPANVPYRAAAMTLQPARLAVLITKYWQATGVNLTVGFIDGPSPELRERILAHMNAWGISANVKFSYTTADPQVRIARSPGEGYWSYLGTDVLLIPKGEPTMNLDSFTMNTPESEYRRVVRHETGHTCGFPHEHMRRELVNRLDPVKTIQYFWDHYGWDAQTVREQVLTPIEESELIGTARADEYSIMAYQLPAEITKDGQPIVGGVDIDAQDYAFAARVYPVGAPPPPPPPGPGCLALIAQGLREIADNTGLSEKARLARALRIAATDLEKKR